MMKISYEDILSAFLYKYHVLSYLFFIKEKTPVKKENIVNLTSVNNRQTFGCGVRISREIADAIGQKPKIVQRFVAGSLNKMDKFARANELDVFVKENRLVNGLYSLRAEYTGKCGKGFVFQPHRAVTVNTVPHLLRELKKDINGSLIEPILKFVDK